MSDLSDLERAWAWREALGMFSKSEAVRVFHGPGEGSGNFKNVAVDRFKDHYWVTQWEDQPNAIRAILEFFKEKNAQSIVGLSRPSHGVAPQSQVYFGNPPSEKFKVKEGSCEFLIQLENTRHPGLFLDHQPLRKWLAENSRGLRVLNAFAYTGSLSIAAAMGGASQVTTLDLSSATIQWARENFLANELSEKSHRFIAGDVFEWLPRLKRGKDRFDCVILDPPSFSHGKLGKFSTSKDLEKLHQLAMDLLADNGYLITSINSANVSWKKYETDILSAAKKNKMRFLVVQTLGLPESFPTHLGQEDARYLKGWILKLC